MLRAFIISERRLWPPFAETRHPSQSPATNFASWLKFKHNIYNHVQKQACNICSRCRNAHRPGRRHRVDCEKSCKRKLHRRLQQQCDELHEVHRRDCCRNRSVFPKTSKFEGIVHCMASVAIIADGAVLNAVAFTDGNFLARFLSGDDPQASLEEKKDMTKLWRLIKPLMSNMKNKEQSCLTGSKRSTKTTRTVCTKTSRSRRPANQSSLTSTSQALCKNKASYFLMAPVLLRLDTLPFFF